MAEELSRHGSRMGHGMHAIHAGCAINTMPREDDDRHARSSPGQGLDTRGSTLITNVSTDTALCADLRSFTVVTSVAMELRYYDMVSSYRLAGCAHCGRCLCCHLVDEGIP
jgi:hypothetical protein